jgi:ParB/RepB/Spo0J family partition protein
MAKRNRQSDEGQDPTASAAEDPVAERALAQQEEPGEPIAVPSGPTTTDGPSALPLEVVQLEVSTIVPDELNPNEESAETFNTLVQTIAEDGFDQPIVVCPAPAPRADGAQYVIAKGEHRWRAARVLGKRTIPAVVRPWDELTRRTRMVRDNVVKGDLNKHKFTELVHSLQTQHRLDSELMASMAGFDSAKEMFGHMVREAKGKKDVDEQAHVDRSKDALKVLDDLSLVLNTIFSKHGHTLPYGFITFMWGGQVHTMVEMQEELKAQVEQLGTIAQERKVDINLLLAAMLRDAMGAYLPAWMKAEASADEAQVPASGDATATV